MRSAIERHYRRNADFYRGSRLAVLMITGLIITLAWELETK
ncbi:hypothetical protein [Pantoea cypripedii]|nr:hypothetical protein [Pantoea cypripedii]MBP2197197.1 hypothetical protein [Pantoea cypripedii]